MRKNRARGGKDRIPSDKIMNEWWRRIEEREKEGSTKKKTEEEDIISFVPKTNTKKC